MKRQAYLSTPYGHGILFAEQDTRALMDILNRARTAESSAKGEITPTRKNIDVQLVDSAEVDEPVKGTRSDPMEDFRAIAPKGVNPLPDPQEYGYDAAPNADTIP